MLRITQSTSVEAAKKYFNESLTKGDYYFEGQEIAGCWGGRAAEWLGLSGEVKKEDFFKLLENQKPDGSKLTLSNKEDRRPGYDFTFDVSKTISVLHAITQDNRIVKAMRRAVFDTMQEIEQDMHARVRKDGANYDRPTGNMVWADFTHFTTRPAEGSKHLEEGMPDPHLHMHVFAMNATFDAKENCWKAGQFEPVMREAPYYQAAYHVRLAQELQKLGYDITPTKDAFEITGIPLDIKNRFSRRKQEIDAEAIRRGITSAKEKDKLNTLIRRLKNHDLNMPEIRAHWDRALHRSERRALVKIIRAARTRDNPSPIIDRQSVGEALNHAIGHNFERTSECSEKRLLATTLQRSVGRTSVEAATYQVREDDRLLIGTIEGERRVTTKEILREETELCCLIRDGRGTRPPLVPKEYQFQEPLFRDPDADTAEQKAAVLHVLRSTDWVTGLVGRAGTGKTTLMQEVKAGLEKNGRKMVVCAPTAEASRGVLRREGFKNADTIAKTLMDDVIQRDLKGNVLWIDEAGMLGNQATLQLLKLANEKGAAKVVLSGDPTQIRSVPRGDAFKLLEARAGLSVARLETIQRQKCKGLKAAVQSISDGDMKTGFQKLDTLDAIKELDDDDRYQQLAHDYADKSAEKIGRHGKDVLVISPTHSEGEKVTNAIRTELKARGKIRGEEREFKRLIDTGWTEEEKTVAAYYEPGMTVKFRQNLKDIKRGKSYKVSHVDLEHKKVMLSDYPGLPPLELPLHRAKHFGVYRKTTIQIAKGDRIRVTGNGYGKNAKGDKYRLNNGDFKDVAGFTADGDIKLKNGQEISKNYGHLSHGVCITADASQAKTVHTVMLAMSKESYGATDMRRAYVGLSRAKHEAYIYTDDKSRLLKAVQRDQDRRTATDLVDQVQEKHIQRVGRSIIQQHTRDRIKTAQKRILPRAKPPPWPPPFIPTRQHQLIQRRGRER
ncbi:MobF family relaxase [Cerasicoccus fimbriatus]|uniref:MobF family relaxase n=1 Tax=Cerasicoccus fimbriatus TaxID=3014554 RepID=UPI0022B30AC8|nr:MobF family relaxase [Cerasicoccus sp. TK19100]